MKRENKAYMIIIGLLLLVILGLSAVSVLFYFKQKEKQDVALARQPFVYDIAYANQNSIMTDLPSEKSNKVANLIKNDKVEILSFSKSWCQVRRLQSVGFVKSSDLSILNTNKMIASASLPFRTSPKNGRLLYIIAKGSVVEVTGEVGEWAKVYFAGRVGYVGKQYLVKYSSYLESTADK